jgi:hypothetical protein
MLTHELANSWLKIGRADEHSKLVSEEIAAWRKGKTYEITSHRQANISDHRLVINFNSRMVRDRWALICGDCVHNLRSALDQLIYAIAVREAAGVDPPPDERRIQFPITDDPTKFSEQEWRLQSLSQTVRTVLEGVQPYNRLHPILPPLLGILRDFDDRDKHRLLNIADHRQQSGNFKIDVPPGHLILNLNINKGILQDGSELMSFTVEPPSLEVKCYYDVSVTIGLSHAPGPSGVLATPIPKVLELLIEEVKEVVGIVGRNI